MKKELQGIGLFSAYNLMIHSFVDKWREIDLTLLSLADVMCVIDYNVSYL